ncbi:MAG TPA: isoprenylcysteine carboxylmethyltransferase family protein [Candidatus Acidoferrales bacterium]|jgi:methyltransferase|nr:isoprenylcysteine carboxylmethyltransferase family protein [Candidatus Acidoferrales bacterium]
MGVSQATYFALLVAVGLGRLVEVRLSARNQRRLAAQGAVKVPEPHFPWMVLLHAGVLGSAALEVLLLRRPLILALALPMGILFVLANALRWWVIASLAQHWNVQLMDSTRLGIVTSGPYRWIRHPNYVAVFVELIALPLVHTAWLTAVWASAVNLWVLRRRLALEERILSADPAYRATMAMKPRFLPRLFSNGPGPADRAPQRTRPQG